MHHSQGVAGRSPGLLTQRQLQELLGKALHVRRAQAGQLVSVGMQHQASSVGLPLLVDEAAEPGAGLQAGAADGVVLVGQEGGLPCLRHAVPVGIGGRLAGPLLLHVGQKRGVGRSGGGVLLHGLDLLVVRADPFAALLLAVPSLLLLL